MTGFLPLRPAAAQFPAMSRCSRHRLAFKPRGPRSRTPPDRQTMRALLPIGLDAAKRRRALHTFAKRQGRAEGAIAQHEVMMMIFHAFADMAFSRL